jgi:hypothetical protein
MCGLAPDVVLADELARMWQVTPPQQAASLPTSRPRPRCAFTSLFGAARADGRSAPTGRPAAPFLAAALPAPLLESLAQAAREARCPLVEVVPQFVAAMNRWRRLRRPGAWFGLVHGGC